MSLINYIHRDASYSPETITFFINSLIISNQIIASSFIPCGTVTVASAEAISTNSYKKPPSGPSSTPAATPPWTDLNTSWTPLCQQPSYPFIRNTPNSFKTIRSTKNSYPAGSRNLRTHLVHSIIIIVATAIGFANTRHAAPLLRPAAVNTRREFYNIIHNNINPYTIS